MKWAGRVAPIDAEFGWLCSGNIASGRQGQRRKAEEGIFNPLADHVFVALGRGEHTEIGPKASPRRTRT